MLVLGLSVKKVYNHNKFIRLFSLIDEKHIKSKNKELTHKDIDTNILLQFKHGRKNNERVDSVTDEILFERYQHNNRIENENNITNLDSLLYQKIEYLDKLGLGKRRKKFTVYNNLSSNNNNDRKTLTGAGGFATHLHSASDNWPIFRHILPEIAFSGHSNSGKSTLVNAIAGLHPKKGPASVSDRAGWTDQICFYQLGKKPPVLIMADLPGYGHAITTPKIKLQWKNSTRDYLINRKVLSRCCVLVDCTRGLCQSDYSLIKFLAKNNIPWQIILTKADLLKTESLAKSILLVENDLNNNNLTNSNIFPWKHRIVVPVSASSGAGIHNLWLELKECANQTSLPEINFNVREHINANIVRSNMNSK